MLEIYQDERMKKGGVVPAIDVDESYGQDDLNKLPKIKRNNVILQSQ